MSEEDRKGGGGKNGKRCRETRKRDDGRLQWETSLGLSLCFLFFSPLSPPSSSPVFQSGWWAERRETLCKSRTAQQLHHLNSATLCVSLTRPRTPLRRLLTQSADSVAEEECLFFVCGAYQSCKAFNNNNEKTVFDSFSVESTKSLIGFYSDWSLVQGLSCLWSKKL